MIMNVCPEIAKIAELNAEVKRLCEVIENKIDFDGFDFSLQFCAWRAYFIENCTEKGGHLYNEECERLDNCGNINNDFYCYQHKGYLDGAYWGTVYFATDKEGVFVAVPF